MTLTLAKVVLYCLMFSARIKNSYYIYNIIMEAAKKGSFLVVRPLRPFPPPRPPP